MTSYSDFSILPISFAKLFISICFTYTRSLKVLSRKKVVENWYWYQCKSEIFRGITYRTSAKIHSEENVLLGHFCLKTHGKVKKRNCLVSQTWKRIVAVEKHEKLMRKMVYDCHSAWCMKISADASIPLLGYNRALYIKHLFYSALVIITIMQ
jgi:hypothetical protein